MSGPFLRHLCLCYIINYLQTLFEAYEEGAIQKAYLSKWLDGIATDLHTLELGAAPTGWKCRWNRYVDVFYASIIEAVFVQTGELY